MGVDDDKPFLGRRPGYYKSPVLSVYDDDKYRNLILPCEAAVSFCESFSNPLAVVSITIRAGNFYDPDDYPGLAHLVEHLVFMGSAAYPKTDGLDRFLKANGGSTNANTEYEFVNYYFEVGPQGLEEALDRVVDMLRAPMLHMYYVTGERRIVNHEFVLKTPLEEVKMQHLLSSAAKSHHPRHRFTWGNMESLGNDANLLKATTKFISTYYVGSRMTVALVAPIPLDQQEEMLTKAFRYIPPSSRFRTPDDDPDPFPFLKPLFCRCYRISGVTKTDELRVSWCLPADVYMWKKQPVAFIMYLINQEGRGSLTAYLRRMLWATELQCSVIEGSSYYLLLNVLIFLTSLGFREHLQVLGAVFSYMEMLREQCVNEAVFRRFHVLSLNTFQSPFDNGEPIGDKMQARSRQMHYCPPQHTVDNGLLQRHFCAKTISKYLKKLVPETANFMLLSRSYKDTNERSQEYWTDVEYAAEALPSEFIEEWKQVKHLSHFHPPENDERFFRASQLLKKMCRKGDVHSHRIGCRKVRGEIREMSLTGACSFIVKPAECLSMEMAASLDIFKLLFQQRVSEDIYPAVCAAFDVTFTSDDSFLISLRGFCVGLPLLVAILSFHLRDFAQSVAQAEFQIAKECVLKDYHTELGLEKDLATNILLRLIMRHTWTPLDKVLALQDLTLDKFASCFDGKFSVSTEYCGRVTEEQKVMMSGLVQDQFQCTKLLVPKTSGVALIPRGNSICRLRNVNPSDQNSVVMNYYQVGYFTHIKYLLLMTFQKALSLMDFGILRTQRLVGYEVEFNITDEEGILGLVAYVSTPSAWFTTSEIDRNITELLTCFIQQLEHMPAGKLDYIRNLVVKAAPHLFSSKLPRANMKKARQYWTAAKPEVLATWGRKYFLGSHEEMPRKISVQVVGVSQLQKCLPRPFHCSFCQASSSAHLLAPCCSRKRSSSGILLPHRPSSMLALEFLEPDNPEEARTHMFITDIHEFKKRLLYY